MALVVAADVSARMSAEDYLKLFDTTGVGSVNATFLATCLATGNSEVAVVTSAAFRGVAFDAAGGTTDDAIKAAAVFCVVKHAMFGNPLYTMDPKGPFAAGIAWADKLLERLAKDSRARPVTSAAGRAHPVASVTNVTDESGAYTAPLTRAADRRDPSGF